MLWTLILIYIPHYYPFGFFFFPPSPVRELASRTWFEIFRKPGVNSVLAVKSQNWGPGELTKWAVRAKFTRELLFAEWRGKKKCSRSLKKGSLRPKSVFRVQIHHLSWTSWQGRAPPPVDLHLAMASGCFWTRNKNDILPGDKQLKKHPGGSKPQNCFWQAKSLVYTNALWRTKLRMTSSFRLFVSSTM